MECHMVSCSTRKLLVAVVLVLAGITYINLNFTPYQTTFPVTVRRSDNYTRKQQERLYTFKHICTYHFTTLLEKEDNYSLRLIYAEKYKLAYISVPKIGSTFLKKMFYVLKFGLKNAHKIFDRMRSEVHATSGELVAHVNRSDLEHVITLITARNPYTRLFSAYIDKVYLPLSLGLGKSIIHENHMAYLGKKGVNGSAVGVNVAMADMRRRMECSKDITFKDFLEFALTSPLRGKAMYDHYAPVTELLPKNVCQLKHFLIIKQETFADDVDFVLKLVNVDKNVYQMLHNHLRDERAESTIVSVVDTTYRQVRMQSDITRSKDCWSMPLIAERLWKSFQLQGFIKDNSNFPKYKFTEKSYHDPGYLINIMHDELQERPLSQRQSKEQRKRAVLKAYENISNGTVSRIHDVYAADFEMFGYQTNLL